MKRFTIVLLLVIFSSTHSLPQSPYQFSDIFFLDDHNGWILSTCDYLWKTTNAGEDWITINIPEIDTSGKIYFADELNGWMLLNTTLLYSADGGNTWIFKYEFPQFSGYSGISFVNQNIGFVTNAYSIYKTINGGNGWTQLTDTLGSISSISTYNQDLIFISTSKDVEYLLKSTDLGVTWNISNEFGSLDPCSFGKVQMMNENYGILLFNYSTHVGVSKLLKTTDSGNSWTVFGSGFEFLFGITDFEFISEEIGYAITNNRFIYSTTNSGLSWNSLQSPSTLSTVIEKIEFFNSNVSFGINRNHIYKTTNGWVTYSIVDSIVTDVNEFQNLPMKYFLEQNYPNPFNPNTKIKFTVPQDEKQETRNVTLKVYDVLGNEVATLVNEAKPAGTYEVNYEAPGISSGIYFYQLRSGQSIQTKKMILIK